MPDRSEKKRTLQRFYNYLTDLAEQFMCDFYVDMPVDRNDCGFLNDYDDHATVRKSKSYLFEAHDVDNFLLGVARIRDNYDSGTLIIPDDSIVFEQLRTIAKIDLEDSPEERFFAINALRHAIGSFHRHPVKLYKHKPQNRPTTWRVM